MHDNLPSDDSIATRTRLRRARRRLSRLCRAGIGAAAAFTLAPLAAGAQDLRYTLTPTGQQLRWNESLGLDNTFLWGGRAGLLFGRRIELQGFFLTNRGTDSGIRDLYDRLGVDQRPPQNPGLDVRHYGASLVYNFAVGGFTPFVRAGGGVLRFDPEGGNVSERIALSYGGGLRFGKPGSLRFNLFVEDLRFRIDRRLLVGLPTTGTPTIVDADANKLWSNLTYGAGVTIPLGGGAATYDDTPQYQLGNVALPIDVFAGRFDFASSSNIPQQNIVGVRTGIDFGPLVGLRGFYWRGANDDFNATQGVQGFGGEAQFALNAGPGINPFLIAGAGQVDFTSSYDRVGAGTVIPEDQTALILGGGVKIPVGSRLVLNASARNWLMGRGGATEDAADVSQLRSNWQYALGFSFGLGGRGNKRRAVANRTVDTVYVDSAGRRLRVRSAEKIANAARDDDRPDAEARERAGIREAYVVTATGDTLRGVQADSALGIGRFARGDRARGRAAMQDSLAGDSLVSGEAAAYNRGYASGRTVPIVVPTQGEIIVRYGPVAPAPQPVIVAGGAFAGQPQGGVAQPQRVLLREFSDARGRPVREFREPDNRVIREYVDNGRPIREWTAPDRRIVREYQDGNRIVREYRTPSTNRVTREFLPIPVPQPSMQYMAPSQQGMPDAASWTVPAPAPSPDYGSRSGVRKEGTAAREGELMGTEAGRNAGAPAAPSTPSESVRQGMSPEEVRALVREESERARREAEERARVEREAAVREALARGQASQPQVVETRTVSEPIPVRYFSDGPQGAFLYSGATVSDGGQLLLGGRLDFGAISPRFSAIRLVPELAFGFGNGGTSTYLAANAMYEFGRLARFRPRVGLGAGLLNFSGPVGSRDGLDVVITPSYGVSIPFGALRGVGTPELVVEHQGVGWFDLNRLIVALAWRR
jgi:hypothetical protein